MTLSASCPILPRRHERVQMAHGGGGRVMRDLIESVFIRAFSNPMLEARHDGAILAVPETAARHPRLAFTTDSYVVRPRFFPGGDIGTLAVNGTVNDLAMCGARPLYLSAAFIIEEGVAVEELERIATSMRRAADAVGVYVVTGDTKVVDAGKGDGVFVTTAGVGVVEHKGSVGPAAVRTGDRIVVSGDLGRHGIAILAARDQALGLETSLESDCAPVAAPVLALLDAGVEVHCLRDLTRGGLGAALVEISESSGLRFDVDERAIPVGDAVAGACEMLGLDPLYVANEGRFVLFVPEHDAERAVSILQRYEVTSGARTIGTVAPEDGPLVTMKTLMGVARVVDLPSGEQLPRIC
jgi:hydrogenase expression/formation protein HypE